MVDEGVAKAALLCYGVGFIGEIEGIEMRKKDKKIFGIGVNDSPDPVYRYERVDGKSKRAWVCPYYTVWKSILGRCYYEPYLKCNPTYQGCSVCPEWIYFMTFKAWMMTQDFEGKELDKDILVERSKVYSPETCRFVDRGLNMFLTDHAAARGEWPIGVSLFKRNRKFMSRCSNPFNREYEFLGYFTCPYEAHEVWRKKKHEHALALADLQTDPDIAQALRERFAPKG